MSIYIPSNNGNYVTQSQLNSYCTNNSLTNGLSSKLNTSSNVYVQGSTGVCNNLLVSGNFNAITGSTGSFTNLLVSGTGNINNLICATGTISNLISNTGTFGNLITSNFTINNNCRINTSGVVSSGATNNISIGVSAGQSGAISNSICLGGSSGRNNIGSGAISLGTNAGEYNLMANSIAVGTFSSNAGGGDRSISMGYFSGLNSTGCNHSIMLGSRSGQTSCPASTVVISTGNIDLSPSTSGLFCNALVGQALGIGVGRMVFNSTTKEIYYSTT